MFLCFVFVIGFLRKYENFALFNVALVHFPNLGLSFASLLLCFPCLGSSFPTLCMFFLFTILSFPSLSSMVVMNPLMFSFIEKMRELCFVNALFGHFLNLGCCLYILSLLKLCFFFFWIWVC